MTKEKMKKKRIIFLAGYTSHYGWHFLGRGLTIDDARKNLKKVIKRAALETIVKTEISSLSVGLPLSNGEELENRLEMAINDSTFGLGYREQQIQEE